MKRKTLLTVMCAVLLVVVSVMGTMAYLTSKDSVKNTFTVGEVEIVLDEAEVDGLGKERPKEERVKENAYHFIPGNVYDKDPTIHIDANSEDAYIVAKVVVNHDLKDTKLWVGGDDGYVGTYDFIKGGIADARPSDDDADLDKIEYIVDGTTKEVTGKTLISKVNTADYGNVYIVQEYTPTATTFTYYFETAQPADKNIVLFKHINIDGSWTNEELAALVDRETGKFDMDITAYAVQAAGFDSVFEAWDAASFN